jgi:hypothetical protein
MVFAPNPGTSTQKYYLVIKRDEGFVTDFQRGRQAQVAVVPEFLWDGVVVDVAWGPRRQPIGTHSTVLPTAKFSTRLYQKFYNCQRWLSLLLLMADDQQTPHPVFLRRNCARRLASHYTRSSLTWKRRWSSYSSGPRSASGSESSIAPSPSRASPSTSSSPSTALRILLSVIFHDRLELAS